MMVVKITSTVIQKTFLESIHDSSDIKQLSMNGARYFYQIKCLTQLV